MEEELKPCPICGETQYIDYYYEDDNEVSVLCHQCTFETHVHRSEKSAARDWNALPRRLRWTEEKPTEEGFYWWRLEEGSYQHITRVVYIGYMKRWVCSMNNSDSFECLDDIDGEWAGPIPEPEDA